MMKKNNTSSFGFTKWNRPKKFKAIRTTFKKSQHDTATRVATSTTTSLQINDQKNKKFQVLETPDGKTIPLSMLTRDEGTQTAVSTSTIASTSTSALFEIPPRQQNVQQVQNKNELSDNDFHFVNFQAQKYSIHTPILETGNVTRSLLANYVAPRRADKDDHDSTIESQRISIPRLNFSAIGGISNTQRVRFAKERLAQCNRLTLKPR